MHVLKLVLLLNNIFQLHSIINFKGVLFPIIIRNIMQPKIEYIFKIDIQMCTQNISYI